MKPLIPFLLLIAVNLAAGQTAPINEPVLLSLHAEQKIDSGLYPFSGSLGNRAMMRGSTTHFSDMVLRTETLSKTDGNRQLHLDEEQIIIIKEGEVSVKFGPNSKTIGPNSVFFLLPGEEATFTSLSPTTLFYRMIYKSVNPPVEQDSDHDISSFVIDYDDLVFHETSKGGVQKYFNRSTAMCPYYEMHVTTLNPGVQSHLPHTHEAAEIILIIKGETEEEIDGKTYRGKAGDVYFLASDVPHTIRNVGEKQCQYFAFQWGASKEK